MKLCQDRFDSEDCYCTKPFGHDGPHVATVGPWTPDMMVLETWPQEPEVVKLSEEQRKALVKKFYE